MQNAKNISLRIKSSRVRPKVREDIKDSSKAGRATDNSWCERESENRCQQEGMGSFKVRDYWRGSGKIVA
jgi:hypothetical protein